MTGTTVSTGFLTGAFDFAVRRTAVLPRAVVFLTGDGFGGSICVQFIPRSERTKHSRYCSHIKRIRIYFILQKRKRCEALNI